MSLDARSNEAATDALTLPDANDQAMVISNGSKRPKYFEFRRQFGNRKSIGEAELRAIADMETDPYVFKNGGGMVYTPVEIEKRKTQHAFEVAVVTQLLSSGTVNIAEEAERVKKGLNDNQRAGVEEGMTILRDTYRSLLALPSD